MNALSFAQKVIRTLGLEKLVPSYAATAYSIVEKTVGKMCAYGNSSGQLVLPNGVSSSVALSLPGLSLTGDIKLNTQILSASGAIAIKGGAVLLTKTSTLGAFTLAAPTAGTDDGKILDVVATTNLAHTITLGSGHWNGDGTTSVITAATTAYDSTHWNSAVLMAYNGSWYVIGTPKGFSITS